MASDALPIVSRCEGWQGQLSEEITREQKKGYRWGASSVALVASAQAEGRLMPGYTAECTSGAHSACVERDCRCQCHPWTQNLVQKAEAQRATRQAEPVIELQNTCIACGAKAPATETFCRHDGSRLRLGKQCLGCGSPGKTEDNFCWSCGLEHGTKPPEIEQEQGPAEDPIVRIKREAVALGLLRETSV